MDSQALQPPSLGYLLGTDSLGRSVARLLLDSAARTLSDVLFAVLLATALGMAVGFLAATTRARFLRLVSNAVLTVSYSTPVLVVVLLFFALFGDRRYIFPLVAGSFAWGGIALATESTLTDQIGRGYVRAAYALGASPLWVARRHLLPNILPDVRAAALGTLSPLFQLAVLFSFLGAGGGEASLGALIRDGYDLFPSAWWLWVPATLVAIFALGGAAMLSQRAQETVPDA
jgi:peptide/nickel transport system permease protein